MQFFLALQSHLLETLIEVPTYVFYHFMSFTQQFVFYELSFVWRPLVVLEEITY